VNRELLVSVIPLKRLQKLDENIARIKMSYNVKEKKQKTYRGLFQGT
jgi:hypothetical protein